MFVRTIALRSSIIVTLGATAVSACDTVTTDAPEPGVAAMALEDADLSSSANATWPVDFVVEGSAGIAVPSIRIDVPAGIAALERRAAAERLENVHPGLPGVLAPSTSWTRSTAPARADHPGRDGLELTLFDGKTGEVVGRTVVEDKRDALHVEIADPCRTLPRCALHLRLEARWLGGDAVRVSPDFEVTSALGRIHLLGE